MRTTTLFPLHLIPAGPSALWIVESGRLIGVVSRANLIQALASVRNTMCSRIGRLDWNSWRGCRSNPGQDREVVVANGAVHLWGLVGSPEERKARIALAESVPSVRSVFDELIPCY